MRTFNHWTPRYIIARIRDIIYIKSHPGHPWLAPAAIHLLERLLKPEDLGLEFGSGRSTLWLAKRVRHLTSIEHNPVWHERIRRLIQEEQITNVEYIYVPKNLPGDQGGQSEYVQVLDKVKGDSLDFVIVDGTYRDFCSLAALEKICPGGLLIIDDAHRYLPSDSRSPHAIARSENPKGLIWQQVAGRLSGWQVTWISSGVKDTAFFTRPPGGEKVVD